MSPCLLSISLRKALNWLWFSPLSNKVKCTDITPNLFKSQITDKFCWWIMHWYCFNSFCRPNSYHFRANHKRSTIGKYAHKLRQIQIMHTNAWMKSSPYGRPYIEWESTSSTKLENQMLRYYQLYPFAKFRWCPLTHQQLVNNKHTFWISRKVKFHHLRYRLPTFVFIRFKTDGL